MSAKFSKPFREKIGLYIYFRLSFFSNIIQLWSYYFAGGLPPEYRKRTFIKRLVKVIEFENAIESGTYFGNTTKILCKYVNKVFSIEIVEYLYKFTLSRNIPATLILGDSKIVINQLLPKISGPTLFFLDAHMSGGITGMSEHVTPLKYELECISGYTYLSGSVILIDDAISITGINDYPDVNFLLELASRNNLICIKSKLNSIIIADKNSVDKILKFYKDVEYLN